MRAEIRAWIESNPPEVEFISKNFALFSAITVLYAVLLAIFYLLGYLIFTDFSAILYVEYTDLAKIAIIAIGIAGIFVLNIFTFSFKSSRVSDAFMEYKIATDVLIIIYVAMSLALSIYFHGVGVDSIRFFSTALSYLTIAILVFAMTSKKSQLKIISWTLFASQMLFISTAIGICVSSAANMSNRLYDIRMKTKDGSFDEIRGATIVLETPHHTILQLNRRTIVVQTPDIDRISAEERR